MSSVSRRLDGAGAGRGEARRGGVERGGTSVRAMSENRAVRLLLKSGLCVCKVLL